VYASGNGHSARTAAAFNRFEYAPSEDQTFVPDMPERFERVPPKAW